MKKFKFNIIALALAIVTLGFVGCSEADPEFVHTDNFISAMVCMNGRTASKEINGGVSQLLTECDLFTVNHYDVKSKIELEADETSFNHILVVDGSGMINDKPKRKGSSFFVPANFGKYEISGECEIIVTNI